MEKPVKKGDFVTKKEAGISVTHSHAVTHGHAITHGYARCSTNEDRQDIDRQTRELKKHGAEKVWLEYEHGDAASKEQQALMLARSTKQLCEIIDIIREKRLRLVIVGSITLDCRNGNPDPMTEAFLQIAGVFSQLELSMIRSRVRSGVENARAKGKRLGRPPVCAERVPEQFLRYYPRYQSGSINLSELARLARVSRPTAYRYLKALT